MIPDLRDFVLSQWIRWSEAIAEEGAVPTTEAALTLFCEHLRAHYPAATEYLNGSLKAQIREWVVEDYLP